MQKLDTQEKIQIWRYTTPQIGIRLYDKTTDEELDLSTFEDIRLVLSQQETESVKSLKNQTLTITDNMAVAAFSQAETAMFQEGTAQMQCHVLTKGSEAYQTEDIVDVKILQPVDRREI